MADLEAQQRAEDARQETEWNVECQRVFESGVPEADVRTVTLAILTRLRVLELLQPGEGVRHECNPFYEVLPDQWIPAYLLVTDRRLMWSVVPKHRTIVSMAFDEVVQVGGQDCEYDGGRAKAIRVSYRPRNLPAPMRRFNPTGELDATFSFPYTSELDVVRMSILARTGFPGPHDDEDRAEVSERLRRLSKDVTAWSFCPICCHDLKQMTDSTMQCFTRRHLFSAPGVAPVIDESLDRFGNIVGQERWTPILESELDFVDSPLIWLAWRDRPFGPPTTLDYQLMRNAWVLGERSE